MKARDEEGVIIVLSVVKRIQLLYATATHADMIAYIVTVMYIIQMLDKVDVCSELSKHITHHLLEDRLSHPIPSFYIRFPLPWARFLRNQDLIFLSIVF
jgi:ABC-type uncharacterized transport system permease subunit